MNFVNQTRLIEMREKNPKEVIHLIYDSALLNDKANAELLQFCSENNITPVDADKFPEELQTDKERTLFAFYKDEVTHLKAGGNLGVASDILRCLSPSYRRGSYTDLDVPLATSTLPETISVDAPLLLNIGSLRLLGKKEMVLALNEFIAVVDEKAAKEQIERIQEGIIKKLRHYSSDYIEKTEQMLSQGSFLNRILMGYMKNRAESLYIRKSTELSARCGKHTSRELRAYVNEVMTNKEKYLDFSKVSSDETHQQVVKRLRDDLKSQQGFIKWLFFRRDYQDVKKVLSQTDDQLVTYMMKKERSLYLKSIVICTTGPIEVGSSLFGNYVMDINEVNESVRPHTFSHYGLHHGFLSRNVIPLHENPLSMLKFLGADVGELNDSSWLEEGMSLQQKRQVLLLDRQKQLKADLPSDLLSLQERLNTHLLTLQRESKGLFGFLWRSRRDEKIKALEKVLSCISQDQQSFDVAKLKNVLADDSLNWKEVFAGFFSKRTKNIIEELSLLCNNAVVYRLAKDKKLSMVVEAIKEDKSTVASKTDNVHDIEKARAAKATASKVLAEVVVDAGFRSKATVSRPSSCSASFFAAGKLDASMDLYTPVSESSLIHGA